ncbi:MAG TPA: nitroreductase family protein [Candidatus Limiplasma sp.]|nr:nitroreductase family protein [Candidatus Limiplasma sp.]HPS82394.1 nitroreductase family protein [Candidatus Limiplasma sp.]
MNVSQAIRERRSVRKYQRGHSIPQEHLDRMLEAAMCAPSACNSRPWEFVVVENADLRQRLTKVHPYCKSLVDASAAIVVCGAPEALPEAPGEGFWPQDCAAATQNLLLQATELGYGTCWCGVYPDRKRAEDIARLIGVTTVPMAMVIVGVPDESPKQRGFYDPARVRYLR